MMDRAEVVAREFHEAYERLAPQYGYDTRTDTKVAWEDVPNENKALMIATCRDLLERHVIL